MVSGGQQKRMPTGEMQVIIGGGQTHLPLMQTSPSGQQKNPASGFEQTFSLGQHTPFTQTVPSGQQNTCVVPKSPQTRVSGQHVPLTQTVPSGQQTN